MTPAARDPVVVVVATGDGGSVAVGSGGAVWVAVGGNGASAVGVSGGVGEVDWQSTLKEIGTASGLLAACVVIVKVSDVGADTQVSLVITRRRHVSPGSNMLLFRQDD